MKLNLTHTSLDKQTAGEKAYSNTLPKLPKKLENIYLQMKIINYKNICHIVLNKIFIEVSDMRVWLFFFNIWESYTCRAIGPYEHAFISMNRFSSAHPVKYGTI